jgi:predicted hotdog family 3-hydroxylacyl-ACP dehydratase
MRGDCSMCVEEALFSAEEIAACAARQGLLSIELEWLAAGECRCPTCATAPIGIQPPLSPTEIQTLVEQAAALGCRQCIIVEDHDDHGMHRDLPRPLIIETTGRGMHVEWITDRDNIAAEEARFFHEHDVVVSLPYRTMTTLVQARCGPDDGPKRAIRLSLHEGNLAELPEQWRRVRAAGMKPRLQVHSPEASPGPSPHIAPERIAELLETLARIDAQEFGRPWSIAPALAARSCKRHLYACHVAACGTVYACAGIAIPLGNIRREPLAEILRLSEVLENLRDFPHKVKEPCRSCCPTCDCYGCRGAAYQATGDYLAGDAPCVKARNTEIPALPVEAGTLIPHGPTIRLVDKIVEVGERRAVAEYRIPADSPLVDSAGRFDECAVIELIAQSFAACHGFHLSAGERPLHKGLLLGVRNLSISGTARVGDTLRIEIHKQVRFGDFSVIEGIVYGAGGNILGRGEIKLWRPDSTSPAPPQNNQPR